MRELDADEPGRCESICAAFLESVVLAMRWCEEAVDREVEADEGGRDESRDEGRDVA